MKIIKVLLEAQTPVLSPGGSGRLDTLSMIQPVPGRSMKLVPGLGLIIELDVDDGTNPDLAPQLIPLSSIRYVRFEKGSL